MYLKSKMRLLGMSALVSVGLVAVSPAWSANVELGDWNVQVDNTVSVGLSMILKDPDAQFLPISNGGTADGSIYGGINATTAAIAAGTDLATIGAVTAGMDTCSISYGGYCQEILAVPNFDGSINNDDGRLNFEKGDIYSAPVRLTTEIEARNGPFTVFGRVNFWHDMIANDEDSFNRGGSIDDDGEENMGQNIELLDAFVSYDGDLSLAGLDMPYTLRAGRQVINWGEATFVPGGNSVFNPIDVAQLRRPGAQIKEALLPVEALYGSIAITQDVSVEAYVGGWDDYRLEAGGTPNAPSDSFVDGISGGSNNPQDIYFIGGGYTSGPSFACNGVTPLSALGTTHAGMSAQVISAILNINGAVDCANNPNLDVLENWTTGNAEAERIAAGDTAFVRGLEPDDGDSAVGLAVRWYAENLNSTEFSLYYQKADSRLPYISYRSGKADIQASSTGAKASVVSRGGGPAGCFAYLTNATIAGIAVPAAGIPAGAKAYNPGYAAVTINDTKNLLEDATLQSLANQAAAGVDIALGGDGTGTAYSRSAPASDNVAYLQETNCLLAIAQSTTNVGNPLTAFDDAGQLHTGATNISANANIMLQAEFPEIETYGMSFNTTAAGWGVQGDFAYRPEAPLQFDTDVLTIASLFNNCLFHTVGALEAIYSTGSTYNSEFGGVGCTDQDRELVGYTTDHDVFTWDIGTTATFTRSNPIVSFLRSDLGIFLTEFQGVHADGIEEDRGNTGGLDLNLDGDYGAAGQGITPLSNVCQGGSDLPLNGILSIDDRTAGDVRETGDNNPKGYCRPTDSSWGIVLMAQLQYNNVFGTPVGLKPQIVYSTGVEGYSPSPMGFWREDVGSTAVSLTADYLGNLSANISYRTYHGDKDRTRNTDRDNLSASVTYAF
jgi:hypothetical protein